MKRIYLDNSATTRVDDRVAKTVVEYMIEKFGNPSSAHSFGQEAKYALDDSREKIAKVINAGVNEIYFTSGGTESDNWAIKGIADKYTAHNKKVHVITSSYEHSAIYAICKTYSKVFPNLFTVTFLSPDKTGLISFEQIKNEINKNTKLVSIMHVNNEIGVKNDISSIGKLCRDNNIIFHTDAVQSFTKIPIDVKAMNIDLLSASSHKIYGPKGVGMLYIRKKIEILPNQYGGHQESGMRTGTENIQGIVGFAKAAEIALNEMNDDIPRITKLRNKLYKLISKGLDNIILNSDLENGYGGILNLTFKGIEGEAVLLSLDLEGIAVSTGSACSTGQINPSRVLLSIGRTAEEAQSSIRFSVGRFNTDEEIEIAAKSVIEAVTRLRSMMN
ncbi:MAG: cysteine desulfurase [Candidatus Delongbacteria bacterium]|nr:cysteine desulfurase [Candidatus Delongbacteria bacterium]MCG2760797.1 cysteine desulfurase [Candidatus Delongbacteria bacterium]